MGFFNKIMFWKKHDDFSDLGLPKGSGKDAFNNIDFNNDPMGFNQGQNFGQEDEFSATANLGYPQQNGMSNGMPNAGRQFGQQQQFPSQNGFSNYNNNSQNSSRYGAQSYDPGRELENKNMEIISSKLDAVRASLDSLNQRLANLEAIARGSEDERPKRKYY